MIPFGKPSLTGKIPTILFLTTLLACLWSIPAAAMEAGNPPRSCEIPENYAADTTVTHIVLVRCTGGINARVEVYSKSDGSWIMTAATNGYIGRNGYASDKREGDGCTPLGDFGITTAFGIKDAPKTTLPYITLTPDIYAVDTDNEYYNKIVDTSVEGPREGEHMYYMAPDYNYGLAIDYNSECVYGRGSNIFLHCIGAKPATAGCIAVEEPVVLYLLQTLSPGDRIIILESIP